MPRISMQLAAALCFVSIGLAADCTVPAGTALRVELPLNSTTHPRSGTILPGSLGRSLYGAGCRAVGEGASIRVAIDRVDHGGAGQALLGVLRLLAGGGAKREPKVSLGAVAIDGPGGQPMPVQARYVRMETTRLRTASSPALRAGERHRMLVLELEKPFSPAAGAETLPPVAGAIVPAGSVVRVDVLTPTGSARARDGDIVGARIAEPLMASGMALLPAGTVLEGVIAQSKPARRPYRAGRMHLTFRSLRVMDGSAVEVTMTPSSGEFAGATRLGPEGELTGGARNRKQALINIGVAYLTGKILDDMIEEGAKAALGAAVAGSAATAARYVALGTGTFLFLMHRGREVSVPVHTELQLTFVRDARIRP